MNMKIYQIIEGRHEHYKDESSGLTILPRHTGAVTLIQTEGKNILIDTGARGTLDEIVARLEQIGLSIEDIDMVLLTHLHLDHSYHVALFPRAQLFAWSHEWKSGETKVLTEDLNTGALLIPIQGITSIRSQGHDECMNSFVIDGGETLWPLSGDPISLSGQKVIISGDAINQAVIKTKGKSIPYAYDADLYRQGAQKILDQKPDIIIPGHGAIIYL